MADDVATEQEVTKTRPRLAQFWNNQIARSGKREKEWRDEATRVVKRYRSEAQLAKYTNVTPQNTTAQGINILWSNVELLKPAVLSRTPIPDVRRRFLQEDPVAHRAAQLIEKALKFTADDPKYDFESTLEKGRDDLLLPGRGVVRVIYDNDVVEDPLQEFHNMETGERFFRTGAGERAIPTGENDEGFSFRERISRQDVYCQYVYWEDYREGDARCWEEVPWVAYRHQFGRKELVDRFGPVGHLIPLNVGGTSQTDKDKGPETAFRKAIVWEIWNKEKREIVWVAEDYSNDVLDVEDDPLGLENFFAQPAPLYAVKTTTTRVPIPEFRQYEGQAKELDEISIRIRRLIKALKVRGLYAGVVSEMSNLLDGDENEVFPVEDWPTIADLGGLDNAITWFPIETIAQVLAGLYNQRNVLKQEIFEITGLSDILRGATDPRETLGAQEIKANFGNVRLTPRQKPMERFVRDIFMIKGEIIAEHFTAEHLLAMTGMQRDFNVTPEQEVIPADQGAPSPDMAEKEQPVTMDQVMALLREDNTRKFTIDIETDSTIAVDEQEEQANVVEFLNASVNYITAAAQAGQLAPTMVPMFLEMYKSAARRFKMGRELEDTIDDSMSKTLQLLNQPQDEADPEAEKAAAELQMKERESQLKMQEAMLDMQLKQADFAAEQQRLNAKLAADIERLEVELEAKVAIARAEAEAKIDREEAAAQRQALQRSNGA